MQDRLIVSNSSLFILISIGDKRLMKELNKDDPLNELVKNGMQMVGPYEELHKCHTQQGYLPG